MSLVYLSCAWLAGIFFGSDLGLPLALALTGLIPLPVLFFVRQQRKAIVLTGLCLIAFFAAAAHSYSSLHQVSENALRFYNDRGTIEVKGLVSSDPEVGDKSSHLNLSITEVKLAGGWQPVEGTARLFVPRYPTYKYGDILLVTGKLETPSQLNDFDYRGYLAHQGTYTTMSYPKIEVQERGKGFKPLEWVYSLRNRLSETLASALPEPQASLAQGIVLGMRSNIPASLKSDFFQTGTTHILAISGMNLSIVAGILLGLGIWLFGRRRFIYIWLALGTIWLYALLTGMQPPVVRAAIMASLFLAAELFGRQRSAITALAFAAAIMAGISPYIIGDASFQLSFLSMAGLVFLFPPLQGLGRRAVKSTPGEDGPAVSVANLASDTISVTIAATIAVWPLVAYYFGIISFAGPLATVLLLPALPGTIITGALTGIVGLIIPPAAQAIGWLAWPFLSYMVVMVSLLAIPSFSFAQVGPVDATLVWAYYLALAAVIWLKGNRGIVSRVTARLKPKVSMSLGFAARMPRKWLIPPLLLAALLGSVAAATMPDDKLHVSFLDVGQGDAILIRKGSQQVLVDGGPSPQAISQALGRQMPFWGRSIDLLVLTHPHQDHVAGLLEVLRRFQVRQVLYPGSDYPSPLYDEWLKLVEAKKIKSTLARAGQQIDLGGAAIKVLNPPTDLLKGTESDIDNNSVVLRLTAGDISFLLSADIMQAAEWELVRDRANLASTVLKVAHHGSHTSTTPEFLAVVDPQITIIPVGSDNRLSLPSDAVMKRLKERLAPERIYRTDEHGTIEFITDGKRLWVKTTTSRSQLK